MSAAHQMALLSWQPPQPAPKASEQDRELARVACGIATVVLDFCRRSLEAGGTFHLSDLSGYVVRQTGAAPSSPDRILRDLKAKGHISYTVERAASRYTLTGVRS